MNMEDIEQWTREAGGFDATPEFLAKFAALVVSAERERLTEAAMKAAEKAVDVAMALEREACSKLVDHILKEGGGTWGDAIRARGQA